ncbi:helix-turn-helix domain-containing protein [Haloarcula sp. S1CR25-12]|uniref:Helix-turn-helix domain-containing protein n=1 Tax=Haloarcula saliterrae TaxID=2950534 RepID=A0ABU2FGD6_9EURY|nr:helix-turn-helix domain-containing protein [Haloarcula sp. S1CR25-12]MDS0260905.1 helix-turn-helix domain-containing protein [Haloarcula sp. S1CR25-12]
MTGDSSTAEMVSARFRKELVADSWIGEISSAFPQQRFELLTATPVADGVLGLGATVGTEPTAAGDAIRTHPDITGYEELHADAERLLARFKWTERKFFNYLRAVSVPPEFPVVVENGVMEFDVTVDRDQFERIGAVLEGREQAYEVVSVVSARESASVLTDRQRECLSVALREGYFSVPRECTLADVAAIIGVDKSTASKTIRRGSERILEWFLVGQNAPEPP